jgi:hypothetical protein
MDVMQRRLLRAAAVSCGLALTLPAAASAEIIEIGKLDPQVKSSCPGPVPKCFAVARLTGYQAKVGTNRGLMTATKDGRIVAFSVGLGKPGPKQALFFSGGKGAPANSPQYGEPEVQVTVLNPRSKLRSRVAAQSEAFKVADYFGTTVQFALAKSIPVKKGQIIAITSKTWAPILAVGLGSDTSWRASREKGTCQDSVQQVAQVKDQQLAQYYCLYRTARLNYSATMVTDPVKPKK